jgi:hypothetical protein
VGGRHIKPLHVTMHWENCWHAGFICRQELWNAGLPTHEPPPVSVLTMHWAHADVSGPAPPHRTLDAQTD